MKQGSNFLFQKKSKNNSFFKGYDGLPIESMQGLDINSSSASNFDQSDLKNDQSYVNYNPTEDNNDSPYVNTIITQNKNQRNNQNELLPNPPPSESNQVAAWYDTDL